MKRCLVCKKGFKAFRNKKYCSCACGAKSPNHHKWEKGHPPYANNTGRKYPKEWCERVSAGLRGKKLSSSHRKSLSKAHIGQTAWNKGKQTGKLSITTRRRMSKAQLKRVEEGNNPFYKGGIYPQNLHIKKSFKYRLWRSEVYKRDNYTCQICGQRGKNLQAHHILLFSEHKEHRFNVVNGMTLCRNCHILIHTKGNIEKKVIQEPITAIA
jgi:hypothetical protein